MRLGPGRAAHVRLDHDGYAVAHAREQRGRLHVPGEHLTAGQLVCDRVLGKAQPDRLDAQRVVPGPDHQSVHECGELDQSRVAPRLRPRGRNIFGHLDLEVTGDQCRRQLRAADVDCQDRGGHASSVMSTAFAATTSQNLVAEAFGVRANVS